MTNSNNYLSYPVRTNNISSNSPSLIPLQQSIENPVNVKRKADELQSNNNINNIPMVNNNNIIDMTNTTNNVITKSEGESNKKQQLVLSDIEKLIIKYPNYKDSFVNMKDVNFRLNPWLKFEEIIANYPSPSPKEVWNSQVEDQVEKFADRIGKLRERYLKIKSEEGNTQFKQDSLLLEKLNLIQEKALIDARKQQHKQQQMQHQQCNYM